MFCKNCGKKIDDDSKFCSNCGVKIIPIIEQPAPPPIQKPEIPKESKEQIIQPKQNSGKSEMDQSLKDQINELKQSILNNTEKSDNTSLKNELPKGPANQNSGILEYVKVEMKPTIIWVDIPAGSFLMGSPMKEVDRGTDETQHQVKLSAFKMSKYEITFEQFDIFCKAKGMVFPKDKGWGRGKRPVINISWKEAVAFCEWMGCRLPTEAEWEYACRAGTTTPFYTGENLTTMQANYNGLYPYNSNIRGVNRESTLPVGSYKPNPWGLFDMHGNVWEWCSDYNGIYQTSIQNNPKGPATGLNRIVRGGSWSNFARNCRSASRNDGDPEKGYSSTGFRLVCPV